MQYRIPFRVQLTPSSFSCFYAAYHGLAYYAVILLISAILPFSKGYLRFAINLLLLLPAILIYLKNRGGDGWLKGAMPLSVRFFFLYFLWTGLSFLWADSQGFTEQGIDVKLNYFALWVNYLLEFLIVFLMCKSAAIDRIAPAYLRGLSIGGTLLAITMLAFWLFGAKSGRLGFFDESATIIRPNWAAIKLATSILCSLHLFFLQKQRKRADILFFAVTLFFMLLALLLTVGKTAILGFILAFLCYVTTAEMPMKTRSTLLFAFGGLLPVVFPFIAGYLQTYIEHETYLTLTDRTTLWGLILERFPESPVIGHGIGSPLPTMWWNKDKIGFTGEGHNEYLNALYSTGIIGLIIVTAIFFAPLIAALQIRRHSVLKIHYPFLLSLFVLMFVFSLTASSPVGFFVPLEFLTVILLWISEERRLLANKKLILPSFNRFLITKTPAKSTSP